MSFSLPNINKEGYLFIAVSFIITCIAFSISCAFGVICLFPTLLCTYFFRDPARIIPDNESFVLSPADGVISKIEEIIYSLSTDNKEEKKFTLISIFLSILDVHVNRVPISGVVKRMYYKEGKFVSATNNKSDKENEKQIILIEHKMGEEVIVEQIAGLIARRIVCNLKVSQSVKAGERFGIIKFGSRVNIYIPADIEVRVLEGQTVVGGETIIADLNKKNTYEKLNFDVI
ncbi:MAG: phosphatidylserine decarboxylase [Wolbachia endosymbiont of Meromenopon meropis]|nr:phosphatidylserine decarboxylase [Wolbachia endosymbiont of Meromenopon meropis]